MPRCSNKWSTVDQKALCWAGHSKERETAKEMHEKKWNKEEETAAQENDFKNHFLSFFFLHIG